MPADRLAKLSAMAGSATWGLFLFAMLLLQTNPPAAGHRSALYSAAGPVLFLMSVFSFVLGPAALVTGVKALRGLPTAAPTATRSAAWLGVLTGGAYTLLLFVPFLAISWLLANR